MSDKYDLWGFGYEIEATDGKQQKKWAGFVERKGNESVIIKGCDIHFRIVKTNDTTPNELELEIINLSADSRAFLYRKNMVITLKVGYNGRLGQVFKGSIELVDHQHDRTEWISKIYAKDGGAAIRDLTIYKTFKEGTPIKNVIEAVLSKLSSLPTGLESQFQEINKLAQREIDLLAFKPKKPKVKRKTNAQKKATPIAEQQDQYAKKKENQRQSAEGRKLKKALILKGQAFTKLKALCAKVGLTFHITDMAISVYPIGLAESSEVITLKSSTGLIGSPELTEKGGWKVRGLIRHEFNPGRIVYVSSIYLDAILLINRVEHRGGTREQRHSELFCTVYEE